MTTSTVDAILSAAERRIRTAGYHAFSFRDLAQDVGIKSASVHHHFATKELLGAAVVRRYADHLIGRLTETPPGPARLPACRELFRRMLILDGAMCVGGLLAAEVGGLPLVVAAEVRRCFARLTEVLADGLTTSAADPLGTASAIIAQMEGAMLLARVAGDAELFLRATADLDAHLRGSDGEPPRRWAARLK